MDKHKSQLLNSKTLIITNEGKIALLEYEAKIMRRTIFINSVSIILLAVTVIVHFLK